MARHSTKQKRAGVKAQDDDASGLARLQAQAAAIAAEAKARVPDPDAITATQINCIIGFANADYVILGPFTSGRALDAAAEDWLTKARTVDVDAFWWGIHLADPHAKPRVFPLVHGWKPPSKRGRYLLCIRQHSYFLVGPYASADALAEDGEAAMGEGCFDWQAVNLDDPRVSKVVVSA
jgi:hypothetical protein